MHERSIRSRLPRRIVIAAFGALSVAVVALSVAQHTQGAAATGAARVTRAVAWSFCMGNGIRHTVAGDSASLRRRGCRADALTFAAVTRRLTLAAGMALHLPRLPIHVHATGARWPINLAACAALLHWSAIGPYPSVAATAAQS
ncbi:hypothetical protein [Rhodanobacter hydrolyticus]|uniref:Uncharacterized protein n=1 Tax=Rhodanobacter hydrolyticus TaxID=2250595 RepID=A0ABW8J431_9GAMM